ncbi:sensor histidine kinase [Pseudoxanthomonas sp. UTMC 1351]|uniref:sensor histidine kinase n=1 Tax=Pseudoxanthomonas sp. UTMC 1351 TaxID=2695853 RepID=UPI0034CE70F4
MIIYLFRPNENSLLRTRGIGGMGSMSGEFTPNKRHWFPVMMLVWSVWIFITPLYQPEYFKNWLWPTVASYAVFLVLYYRAYFGDRRQLLGNTLGIAALSFVVTPFNPGAQGYLIYACAFFAFCATPRGATSWMVVLLALYVAEWLWLGWSLLYMASAVLVGLAVGLMNISVARRAQADAALALSHEEVRRLAALAERERIGRDLHDLLGHTLSLVALKSDLAGKLMTRDPLAAKREIDDVSRVARDALSQVRRAVSGIRAAGLAAELASAKLLMESDGVAFAYQADPKPIPPELETVLALAVREAVTNIQRHARAGKAEVSVHFTGGQVILRVVDDGRGSAVIPGNGLTGMRERLEALGGGLRIDSAPNRGTTLEVQLPLPPADRDRNVLPAAMGPASLLP